MYSDVGSPVTCGTQELPTQVLCLDKPFDLNSQPPWQHPHLSQPPNLPPSLFTAHHHIHTEVGGYAGTAAGFPLLNTSC